MSAYDVPYRNQRTTPRHDGRGLLNRAPLVYGMAATAPPVLLGTTANRIRSGRLRNVNVHSLTPQVLDVEHADSVPADSWFASGGEPRPSVAADFPRAASFRRPADAGYRSGERA